MKRQYIEPEVKRLEMAMESIPVCASFSDVYTEILITDDEEDI